MAQTKKQLIQLLESLDYSYEELKNESDIELVYNMFKNNKPIEIMDDINHYDPAVLTYLGYYYFVQKDYDNMKKDYLMAINYGNTNAMNNLGYYYHKQKDYENMKKYYLMAINHGNNQAMNNLAVYYYEQKDYENMKKYYLMALDNDNNDKNEIIYSTICKYYDGFYMVDKYFDFINKYIKHVYCTNEMRKILSDQYRFYFYTSYIRNKRSTQSAYNNQCPICLDENGDKILLKCNHQMCLHCLKGLIETKSYVCPVCRHQIS